MQTSQVDPTLFPTGCDRHILFRLPYGLRCPQFEVSHFLLFILLSFSIFQNPTKNTQQITSEQKALEITLSVFDIYVLCAQLSTFLSHCTILDITGEKTPYICSCDAVQLR